MWHLQPSKRFGMACEALNNRDHSVNDDDVNRLVRKDDNIDQSESEQTIELTIEEQQSHGHLSEVDDAVDVFGTVQENQNIFQRKSEEEYELHYSDSSGIHNFLYYNYIIAFVFNLHDLYCFLEDAVVDDPIKNGLQNLQQLLDQGKALLDKHSPFHIGISLVINTSEFPFE